MKGDDNLFKESIRFPLIFFVVSVIWQLLFNNEVKWIDNIGVFFIMCLFFLLDNMSKKSHKGKKDSAE